MKIELTGAEDDLLFPFRFPFVRRARNLFPDDESGTQSDPFPLPLNRKSRTRRFDCFAGCCRRARLSRPDTRTSEIWTRQQMIPALLGCMMMNKFVIMKRS